MVHQPFPVTKQSVFRNFIVSLMRRSVHSPIKQQRRGIIATVSIIGRKYSRCHVQRMHHWHFLVSPFPHRRPTRPSHGRTNCRLHLSLSLQPTSARHTSVISLSIDTRPRTVGSIRLYAAGWRIEDILHRPRFENARPAVNDILFERLVPVRKRWIHKLNGSLVFRCCAI